MDKATLKAIQTIMAQLEDPNHPSYREDEWERWEALSFQIEYLMVNSCTKISAIDICPDLAPTIEES